MSDGNPEKEKKRWSSNSFFRLSRCVRRSTLLPYNPTNCTFDITAYVSRPERGTGRILPSTAPRKCARQCLKPQIPNGWSLTPYKNTEIASPTVSARLWWVTH